jgi:hypothetical protein
MQLYGVLGSGPVHLGVLPTVGWMDEWMRTSMRWLHTICKNESKSKRTLCSGTRMDLLTLPRAMRGLARHDIRVSECTLVILRVTR